MKMTLIQTDVEKVIRVPEPTGVSIELTLVEAAVLLNLVSRIGGWDTEKELLTIGPIGGQFAVATGSTYAAAHYVTATQTRQVTDALYNTLYRWDTSGMLTAAFEELQRRRTAAATPAGIHYEDD